uniref:Secreted Ig-containing protein n=1 Tax=Pristhesancus plagipennis TaxID=1955184 RepID=A0A2K8JSX5_PRIPG|nr:secreted Ig-containing protein [Pristhesancus plagipennis]
MKMIQFVLLLLTITSVTVFGNEGNLGISYKTKRNNAEMEIPSLRGPYFDRSVSKNVTALVGRSAFLYCRVRNLGNRTVSWIRHRDLHLLTVGSYTYTSDQRFFTTHSPQTEEWTLQIRFPQIRDSGCYECQIGTNPPIGLTMMLTVVEPVTKIIGSPDLHINYGSTINLTCMVVHSPVPPPSIIWTHNDKEVNYDSPRGGVSVITEKGDITTSYLLIQKASYSDSGSYKCTPSNANPHSIFVHVMNEKPEAMQRGSQLRIKSYSSHMFLTSLIICLLY